MRWRRPAQHHGRAGQSVSDGLILYRLRVDPVESRCSFRNIFRLERLSWNGALQLLGIEYDNVGDAISIRKSDIDSLIAHSRLGKLAEMINPTLRKMVSHYYLIRNRSRNESPHHPQPGHNSELRNRTKSVRFATVSLEIDGWQGLGWVTHTYQLPTAQSNRTGVPNDKHRSLS